MAVFDRLKTLGKKTASDNPHSKILREDKGLRSKLEEVNTQVPRYLFRMWHSTSGGNPELNTVDKITPLAFLQHSGHENVYDMPIRSFVVNAINISTAPISPPSSLRESAYIAVIDTLGLRADSENSIFYVPALASVFERSDPDLWANYLHYDWEFLVHGVVEGVHYKAVSFRSLRDAGLTDYLPALEEGHVCALEYNRHILPGPTVPFTVQELHKLTKMAELFGSQSQMRAAMLITLFCCEKRVGFGTELKKEELEEIVKCLGGKNNIPHNWCAPHPLCKDIDGPCYEDSKQMVNVMRAVSAYCWGK